jgi:transcription elongation factor Elf1
MAEIIARSAVGPRPNLFDCPRCSSGIVSVVMRYGTALAACSDCGTSGYSLRIALGISEPTVGEQRKARAEAAVESFMRKIA